MNKRNRNNRNRYHAHGHMINRDMNDDTYALRRMVMAHVYSAKRVLAEHGYRLPRIDIRIGDKVKDETLACARMGDNIIWIDADTTRMTDTLQHIVYHELCHAVIAQDHVTGCPLMNPSVMDNTTPAVIEDLFIKYMTGVTKSL